MKFMIKVIPIGLLFFMFFIDTYGQKNIDNLCEPSQQVNGNITSGWYKASTVLTSNATIDEVSTVIFTAEERIQLNENFSVATNCNFTATNYACKEIVADIIAVTHSGNEGSYTFAVTIQSPDTGCNQYANWWEVVSLDEQLIYRRVLGHSHINEQPFTRSGGSVNINAGTEVIIRAWMHPTGYGGAVFKGSITKGFKCEAIAPDFAEELSTQPPLPSSCPF